MANVSTNVLLQIQVNRSSGDLTQRVEGVRTIALIDALKESNRLHESRWINRNVLGCIELIDGTNSLVVGMYRDGTFDAGDYHFRLKSPITVPND